MGTEHEFTGAGTASPRQVLTMQCGQTSTALRLGSLRGAPPAFLGQVPFPSRAHPHPLSTTYTRQTQNSQKNEYEHARAQATRHPKNIQGGNDVLTSKWCREGPLGCGCTEPERHICSCLKGYKLTRPHCSVPGTLCSRDRGISSHLPKRETPFRKCL